MEFDMIRMRVTFPGERSAGREPLVVTGEAGRGDFLFVEYLEGGWVQFGLDHWGKATVMSARVSVERGKSYEIEIGLGAFPGARKTDELEVKIKLHAEVSVELSIDVVSENPIEPAAQ